jgi:hypothetical protein
MIQYAYIITIHDLNLTLHCINGDRIFQPEGKMRRLLQVKDFSVFHRDILYKIHISECKTKLAICMTG